VVYQAHSVRAFHPGGDKSLRVFFLKNAWRRMGMFGMLKNSWLFKPVLTVFAHVLLCILAVANLFASHSALIVRVVIFVDAHQYAAGMLTGFFAGRSISARGEWFLEDSKPCVTDWA